VAYEGWQYVTFSAGEAIDPQRTFPRAIVIGTASLVGIYLLANVGYLAALGVDGVASRIASPPKRRRHRRSGSAKLIAAAILVSIFSATNGLTISAPRSTTPWPGTDCFPEAWRCASRYGTPR